MSGYSEPGRPGPIWPSVQTKGEDKATIGVNGQKIWTSYGRQSPDWIFGAASALTVMHQGITAFPFCDRQEGRTGGRKTRPIKVDFGASVFCETFLPIEKGQETGSWRRGTAVGMLPKYC